MHVIYNAANNLQTAPVADTADANGKILGSPYSYLRNAFDIDNRLIAPGNNATIAYSYDAGTKRIWRGDSSAGLDEFDFFAAI